MPTLTANFVSQFSSGKSKKNPTLQALDVKRNGEARIAVKVTTLEEHMIIKITEFTPPQKAMKCMEIQAYTVVNAKQADKIGDPAPIDSTASDKKGKKRTLADASGSDTDVGGDTNTQQTAPAAKKRSVEPRVIKGIALSVREKTYIMANSNTEATYQEAWFYNDGNLILVKAFSEWRSKLESIRMGQWYSLSNLREADSNTSGFTVGDDTEVEASGDKVPDLPMDLVPIADLSAGEGTSVSGPFFFVAFYILRSDIGSVYLKSDTLGVVVKCGEVVDKLDRNGKPYQ
ncbi:hypothetical protein BC938DRAFT_472320 [Jimgerdemannia flammicorona]|uniref:Uncharacterized protein n=1 Tax=Jimgerdemannia flammicorona TaxID=994334 RepID=A0A433Q6F2_9FUNG|nr:hypothetical protein BC938DRAFT_472320 [Jimgerdemannia flammicorona]